MRVCTVLRYDAWPLHYTCYAAYIGQPPRLWSRCLTEHICMRDIQEQELVEPAYSRLC